MTVNSPKKCPTSKHEFTNEQVNKSISITFQVRLAYLSNVGESRSVGESTNTPEKPKKKTVFYTCTSNDCNRHFLNRCDIYKVTEMVHESGQKHGFPYFY